MKLFADSKSLEEVEKDFGESVGQLLTPLTYRRNFRPTQPFGIDNGCFKEFHRDKWLKMLEREKGNAKNCKFVALPDVVGSAIRTLELFEHYRHLIMDRYGFDYPVALVIQNGQENLPIEWEKLDAIFIGGDTRFKMSQEVVQIIQCAKILGKYVHVGRVNEPSRWQHFENLGCDSFDGTGISQFTKQRFKIAQQRDHPKLYADETNLEARDEFMQIVEQGYKDLGIEFAKDKKRKKEKKIPIDWDTEDTAILEM